MRADEELERGRASCARGAWQDAYAALSSADAVGARWAAADLELLATSAYMLGRDEEYVDVLERAHQASSTPATPLRAARSAFWIGMQLCCAGEIGRGTGWLGRAQRLVEREPEDCVERGYLLMPLAFQREATGDLDGAAAAAGEAAAIARALRRPDLFALALHVQGHLLVAGGPRRGGPRPARRGDGRGHDAASCRRSSAASSTAA